MRQASSHIERQGLKEKAAVSDDRGLFLSWRAARSLDQSRLVIVTDFPHPLDHANNIDNKRGDLALPACWFHDEH
jgi:hypothetical protein